MILSDEYEIKKKAIACEFKKDLVEKSTFTLSKKTSNLFRSRKHDQAKKLNVKKFTRVISIDPTHLTAEVEAMITYEDLVRETLKYNCLPPVVPELKTITVGGALVGLGIESSSFRYGLVHETILEVDVLTANGTVLTCTPDNEHRDLFFSLPNSYGTLGYALRIKLKLIPAKQHIRLTNIRFTDINTYFDKLNEVCTEKAHAYIDGVIFSKNEAYIILGDFVDKVPFTSDYTYMSIYFKSIRSKKTNYLTTHDYIWRWDADWFWCSKHFGMNSKILRLLFGKFMLKSATYWKLMRLANSNPLLRFLVRLFEKPSESVIQDILIPIQNAPSFYDFFLHTIGITPIWICPFQAYHPDRKYPLFTLDPSTLYMDFGFWDIVPSHKPKGHLNRLIEQKAKDLQGYKSLYSDSFYSSDEFWQIHSQSAFAKIKEKYDPKKVFKDLYDKCVRRNY